MSNNRHTRCNIDKFGLSLKKLIILNHLSYLFSTYSKKLLEASNLIDIHRKMALYKAIFYCNACSDRDPNFIKAESLQIELIAGGLSWDQQQYVMEKMKPNAWREVRLGDISM